ncbi:signal transduction histidine kinase [Lysobacter enzymogenes]|jgi:signal transduction histidine kinase|uniref:sensor histidine kinase n=1 Tax=Lysobacter enzymogenes TaxID=69 RepID=UPI000898D464|nr:sensor histidine kinase [Lysobacter enzymogenes]SDW96112.1 Histidine kinase-, DNA gyrase B-, and HSP90-like ATPase [Lysobacter enzymogenes]
MSDPSELRALYRDLLQRLQRNEREFRRLGRAVWRVQEDERRRIARDLHDGVGQNLTALKLRLHELQSALDPAQAALHDGLAQALALCGDTLEDTRELSRLLRPPILDDLGLASALRWLARSHDGRGGARVELELGELPELDGELQTLLFRTAQEALANASRHAQARRIRLSLQRSGEELHLQVRDDGCGCDPAAAMASGGNGLSGMRERLRLYGGRLDLSSAPGAGLRLSARVPLDYA